MNYQPFPLIQSRHATYRQPGCPDTTSSPFCPCMRYQRWQCLASTTATDARAASPSVRGESTAGSAPTTAWPADPDRFRRPHRRARQPGRDIAPGLVPPAPASRALQGFQGADRRSALTRIANVNDRRLWMCSGSADHRQSQDRFRPLSIRDYDDYAAQLSGSGL